MADLKTFDYTAHFTLGRLLGLAQIARDPKTWQMAPERVVEMLIDIADEYEDEQKKNLLDQEGA